MRKLITLLTFALLIVAHVAPSVAAQEPCRFVLGFATLRDLIGAEKVGNCLEDQQTNPENGNAEQRTTGGLMVWRKADNVTAFTDGGTMWLNGPQGFQTRPNSERFDWERDPPQPAAAPPAPATTAPAVTQPPAALPPPTVVPARATATPALAPSGGQIICRDGYHWPGTTRQGACNGHGGIAP